MVVSNRHHGYCCGGWGREREELVGREVALVNLRASRNSLNFAIYLGALVACAGLLAHASRRILDVQFIGDLFVGRVFEQRVEDLLLAPLTKRRSQRARCSLVLVILW